MTKKGSPKIVIGRMGGGIGNQLFTYAACKSFALHYGAKYILDLGGFLHDKIYKREWLLEDAFSLNYDGRINIGGLIQYYTIRGSMKLLDAFPSPLLTRIFEPRPCSYYDAPYQVNKPYVEYIGNWQSELYFREHREDILQDLKFALEIPAETAAMRDQILNNDSAVCVHIRNYTDIADVKSRTLVQNDYYEKAIKEIVSKVPSPKYFLFTDSHGGLHLPKTVMENCTFVNIHESLGNRGGLLDLYLMSHCKHFIVANSSFSWWGCYLSQNNWGNFEDSDRIAVFPSANLFHKDFVPEFGLSV